MIKIEIYVQMLSILRIEYIVNNCDGKFYAVWYFPVRVYVRKKSCVKMRLGQNYSFRI